MKTCYVCKLSKELTEFGCNKTRSDGLQSRCKLCDRERGKNYYHANENQQKAAKERKKRRLEAYQQQVCHYLLQHPCVDCGERDIVVLEFDHLDPATKLNAIGTMIIGGQNWKFIETEMAKCEVRCANCHRRRTAKQFGNYRLKYTEGFDSERFHKQKLIDMQEYVVTQHINRQNNSPFFLLPY